MYKNIGKKKYEKIIREIPETERGTRKGVENGCQSNPCGGAPGAMILELENLFEQVPRTTSELSIQKSIASNCLQNPQTFGLPIKVEDDPEHPQQVIFFYLNEINIYLFIIILSLIIILLLSFLLILYEEIKRKLDKKPIEQQEVNEKLMTQLRRKGATDGTNGKTVEAGWLQK